MFLSSLIIIILLYNAGLLQKKIVDHGCFLQVQFRKLLHLVSVALGLPVLTGLNISLRQSTTTTTITTTNSHLNSAMPDLLEAGADSPPPGGVVRPGRGAGGEEAREVVRSQGY